MYGIYNHKWKDWVRENKGAIQRFVSRADAEEFILEVIGKQSDYEVKRLYSRFELERQCKCKEAFCECED